MSTLHLAQRFCLAAALLLGCTTPSVPIPPPSPEKVYFSLDLDSGTASFGYAADPSYADAVVYIFNRDAGQGIITTAEADGSVGPTEAFPAVEGDEVIVTFEAHSQVSSTCLRMQDGQSNSGRECEL